MRRLTRIGWILLEAMLMLGGAPSGKAQGLKFEAEEGVLHGKVAIANQIPGFSGSGYVTSFHAAGDSVDIRAAVPAGGFYTLKIGYHAQDMKFNPVLINGSYQGDREFPKTAGFAEMTFGRVALNAGDNTVTIGSDWGFVDVDYIRLEPAPAPVPFNLAPKPVTPGASPEACELLASLDRFFLSKTLAGQQDEHGSRRAYIAQVTGGKAPAVLGLDLLNYSGAFGKPGGDGQIERARDWVLKRHGIVTISWHWFSPFGATEQVWRSFYTNKTTFDASRVADEKSPEYQAIVSDIDRIAASLAVLRDAHVPVLWRPLHEAEGKWFWWGSKGPETAKRIYRLMFDRFTRVHGLNNLIWVWTTTDNPDALAWYPGDDVVDIVGADIYPPVGTRGTFLPVFDNLRQIYGGRKPIALCETGALIDPGVAAREGADWLWFLVWDDYISRTDANPAELVSRVYKDGGVVTLDGLTKGLSAKRVDEPEGFKDR